MPNAALSSRRLAACTALACTVFAAPATRADSGAWVSPNSGNWTDPANWSVLADGSGYTADFTTVDIAADVTVSLNGVNRTIGNLTFGDLDPTATAAGWIVTGNTLTLAGATPTLTVNTLGTGKVATINSTLSGSAGFTKTGAGQLTISNGGNSGLSGALVVNQGVLVFNTTVNYTDALSRKAPVTVNAGAELRFTGGVNNFIRDPAASDAAVELIGGTFDYQSSTHGHMGDITLRNGGVWKATAGGGYNGENMQLDGTVTVANTGGNTTASTLGPFSQGLALWNTREFNVADVTGNANADLMVSAELEDNDGGAGDGILKTGGGTMSLTTGASYSGATTVNDGRLLVGSTLRSTSGITVNNGATVELGATNVFTGGHGTAVDNARVLTANGSTLLMNGSMDSRIGNVTLNNASTWTSNRGFVNGYDVLLANTTTGAATVSVTGTGASTINGSGGIHLQGVQNFAVANVTGDAAADLTVSIELGGPGSTGGAAGGVNKTGGGTLTLTRAATYLGGTTVNEGVVHMNGGTGGSALLRGTVTVKSGAELRLSGGDGTGLGYNSSAAASQRVQALNIEGGLVNALNNIHFYHAALNMTGGTMQIGAGQSGQFGNIAVNTLASGDTATLAGDVVIRSDTWNGLTPNLVFTVAEGAATMDLLVSSRLQNHAAGGGGNSRVTKEGGGTMVLSGDNTYAGTTAVNVGTVLINGTQNLSAGLISVSSAATLGGVGTMGAVDINGGATLSPGGSAGTITVGDLDLDATSILKLELGDPGVAGASDRVVVKGFFNDGAARLNVSLAGAYTPAIGNSWLVIDYTATGNSLAGGANLALGTNTTGVNLELDLSQAGQVWLVAVPEPAAGALFAFALVLLRRRLKR